MSFLTKELSPVYKTELEKGVLAFYSGDWESAQSTFDSLIEINSTQPEAYFFRSMIPFWSYFFGGESKSNAETFLLWSDKAIRVTESHLKNHPTDTTSVLFLSGLHGYRALVAADQNEFSIAIKSGLTGFNFTKKILSMGKDQPDAKIGRGIYYYMTGSVPTSIKWMTSALGFDGTKELGFKELENAAANQSNVQTDAKMILSYLYLKEKKPELALPHLESLLNSYPKNVIFYFYKAQVLEELKQTNLALNAYSKVIELNNSDLKDLKRMAELKVENLKHNFSEKL